MQDTLTMYFGAGVVPDPWFDPLLHMEALQAKVWAPHYIIAKVVGRSFCNCI